MAGPHVCCWAPTHTDTGSDSTPDRSPPASCSPLPPRGQAWGQVDAGTSGGQGRRGGVWGNGGNTGDNSCVFIYTII